MGDIVTAQELGQYLKLSDSSISKLASRGGLPGFKIGESWRFHMDGVFKLITKAKKGNDGKSINIFPDQHKIVAPIENTKLSKKDK